MNARRALAGLSSLLLAAWAVPAVADSQASAQIERGQYLAIVGDCVACHTVPGGAPFAGGLPTSTPFGKLVAPNITPDDETGIGAWTDAEFLRAFHEGRGAGGKHLYPAFPFVYYTKVSDEDVLAIRAWLRTLAPVRRAVVANRLPFPFDVRASLIAWDALNFKPGRFKPVSGKSAQWNRGAYLVQGLGHCGGCHTAKSATGGDETNRALQGGELDSWFAPSIVGDTRRGIGGWTAEQIVAYLKTGHNDIAAASGPMGEVVMYSTSRMHDPDLAAMAVYLKDLPAPAEPHHDAVAAGRMQQGKELFTDQCSACHTAQGSGVGGLFPALAHAPSVQSTSATSLIRVILQGAASVATDAAPTGAAMPSFDWKLSDDQVAAVVSYIRNDWGNSAAAVSGQDVATLRHTLAQGKP